MIMAADSEAVRLDLPWPPSVNGYWRTAPIRGRGGKTVIRTMISKQGRKYRRLVAFEVVSQRAAKLGERRLAVDVVAYPPDRQRRDIDNISKSLLDAMEHAGVYADDEQIDRLVIERGEVSKPGSVAVTIRPMESTP